MSAERTSNDWAKVIPTKYGDGWTMHRTFIISGPAELAWDLLRGWTVPIDADGEDSQGRSQGKRLKGQELVDEACDVAERFYAAITERGWYVAKDVVVEEVK